MEDPRSALDNQWLNVTRRKRGTRHALAWEFERGQMLQRLKKVTLCSRILFVKGAEGACHQRSTEVSSERRTVIADPQPASPFDRNNYPVRVRVDRGVHFPVIPRYASLLWLADLEFANAGWSAPMAAISKTDDSIKHTCANMADNTGIKTNYEDSGRDIWRALDVPSAAQNAMPAALSGVAGI